MEAIQTDAAAEYDSKGYCKFLCKKGICQELSTSSQQNGHAKRAIQMLNSMAAQCFYKVDFAQNIVVKQFYMQIMFETSLVISDG
jgi:hypothetical protein